MQPAQVGIKNRVFTRYDAKRRTSNHERCTNVIVKGEVFVKHRVEQARKVGDGVCVGHGTNMAAKMAADPLASVR